MRPDQYDDGLDADGFPIKQESRTLYQRGSEEAAGDWQPRNLSDGFATAVERIGHLAALSPACDSPIEVQLGAALRMAFDRSGLNITLVPQFAWSFYRTDWAVFKGAKVLLIECDGADFHSSDKQRDHDARKDAAAELAGYRTIRFTGSQIHRHVDDCAKLVLAAVRSL
jgi:very-short-patch-repair endonuclease